MSKVIDFIAFVLISVSIGLYFSDEMMAMYLTMAATAVLLFIQDNMDDRTYFKKRIKQVQQRRAARLKAAN